MIWASGRVVAGEQMRFVFPERAIAALGELDPREAVRIEVLDARGRIVETLFVEVGDFAAGAAFLAAGNGMGSGGTGG